MSSRITPATWEQVITNNEFHEVAKGLSSGDPFDILAKRAAMSENSGQPHSQVTVSLTNSSEDYSRVKVFISISIPCACNEADISLAGEAGFIKAHQMVNEASAALRLPLLG
jgi:hypothetical protein